MDRLEKLWRGVRPQGWNPPARLLVLDPGDTTGWCLFVDGRAADAGQAPGTLEGMTALFDIAAPTLVVYESYLLYPWAAGQQAFSDLPTARLIGALQLLCHQRSLPSLGQTAQQAKSFVGDERLKELHVYISSRRHANDATRHGVYALVANKALPQGPAAEAPWL